MNKIYYVMIKGRTFESRNIKHLLARAVAEKRNNANSSMFSTPMHRCTEKDSVGNHYRSTC
jgi:hypothetical protein